MLSHVLLLLLLQAVLTGLSPLLTPADVPRQQPASVQNAELLTVTFDHNCEILQKQLGLSQDCLALLSRYESFFIIIFTSDESASRVLTCLPNLVGFQEI